MAQRLDGRVAIVTGAGQGIGRGIATVFGREGARVLVVDRERERAERTADEIGSAGGSAAAFQADVSRQPEAEAMAKAALERWGRIDVLAQNVGVFPVARNEDMSEELWDRVLAVNAKSLFLAVKAVLPAMKQQHAGRIVVTSSITGPKVGMPGLSHYAASKGAINGFIRAAALELAPHNVTINAVEPGNVLTEGICTVLKFEEIEEMARAIPLKRLAELEEVGHAFLFLVSDEAKYITGQTLVGDGGQILPEMPSAVL